MDKRLRQGHITRVIILPNSSIRMPPGLRDILFIYVVQGYGQGQDFMGILSVYGRN